VPADVAAPMAGQVEVFSWAEEKGVAAWAVLPLVLPAKGWHGLPPVVDLARPMSPANSAKTLSIILDMPVLPHLAHDILQCPMITTLLELKLDIQIHLMNQHVTNP
jgi:hypothetical protein